MPLYYERFPAKFQNRLGMALRALVLGINLKIHDQAFYAKAYSLREGKWAAETCQSRLTLNRPFFQAQQARKCSFSWGSIGSWLSNLSSSFTDNPPCTECCFSLGEPVVTFLSTMKKVVWRESLIPLICEGSSLASQDLLLLLEPSMVAGDGL